MEEQIIAWPAAMRRIQAAQYCGLSGRTFDRLTAAGTIKPRSVGGTGRTILYLRSELDAFLQSLPQERGQRVGVSAMATV